LADLPVSSASIAPAAGARPATDSPRGAGANAIADPFQAILAQELGQMPDGRALPGHGVAAVAAKAAAAADPGLKPVDDTAQADVAPDASLLSAFAGAIPFSPALAAASLAPPADTGRTPLSFAVHRDPLAPASMAPTGAAALPTASSAAEVAAPGSFPPLAKAGAAPMSAQDTELPSPIAPAAAELAASAKSPLSASGELRREAAFAVSLPEQRGPEPPASAAAAGIPIGGAPPDQIAPAPAAALETRVGAHGWDQGLGDKLVWMAGHGQQVAELHLNPPDLGPLKITLTLNNDQASAQFVSAHLAVREAIETAMPRLRDMLADSGITLGNTSVSADAFREQANSQPQPEPRGYAAPSGTAIADLGVIARGMQLLTPSRGLVDTFA
jgi:flagellar hook-length control protein FliK